VMAITFLRFPFRPQEALPVPNGEAAIGKGERAKLATSQQSKELPPKLPPS
jgi:hypothetical protein